MVTIQGVQSLDAARLEALAALLCEVVADGASVGFLAPLTPAAARAYWTTVAAAPNAERCLWVAVEGEALVGTVQLALATKENARHRAEVQKLLVLPAARQRGIARALMATLEAQAVRLGRTLLVLDTLAGSVAETLYERLGWQRAGAIPDYAATPDGSLHPTVLFWKRLPAADPSLPA